MPWRYIRESRYSSTILDLDTRRKWVVSFTHRPLYSRRKSPRYPLTRRLSGAQNRSGCCGENKNLDPVGNWTAAVHPEARRCTDSNETLYYDLGIKVSRATLYSTVLLYMSYSLVKQTRERELETRDRYAARGVVQTYSEATRLGNL
jgi:hypothetical protein